MQRAAVAGAASRVAGRRQWPLPKEADPDAPLLRVEHLTTQFRLPNATVHAVDDVELPPQRRRGARDRRRVRLRQDHDGALARRPAPANGRVVGGSVRLFGIDLVKKSPNALRRYRWREIAIVFQGAMNALNPVRRIRDQVAEPLEERLDVPKGGLKRAGELLELVGIPKARGSAYPHELSGGMRQRTMIAMALACDPAVIIGDEPTTALDVMVQAQILELFERLRLELGLSLILITHDLSVIAETCDRVLIMYAGKVAEEGPVGPSSAPAAPVHGEAARRLPEHPCRPADARGDPRPAAGPPEPRRLPLRRALPDGQGRVPRGSRRPSRRSRTGSGSPATSGRRARTASPRVDDARAGRHRRRRRAHGAGARGSGRMTDERLAPRGRRGPLPDPRPVFGSAGGPAGRAGGRRDRPHDPARRGPRPRRRVRARARRRPAG